MPDETPSAPWSSMLVELTREFGSRIELDELLPFVLRQTREALAAESCSILLLDESANELFIPLTSDLSSELEAQVAAMRFPAHLGIAGDVLRTGEAVHVPRTHVDPRFYAGIDDETGSPTRDLMCAPLPTEQGNLGVIQVRNRQAGSFSEQDLALLTGLSESIAVALANGRRFEKLRRSEARLRHEVGVLQREKVRRDQFSEIVGNAAAMRQVFSLMESAISTEINVLVQGETGVGKEIVARAIHDSGPRKGASFIAVNCGALQETLLESELFGVRRGAFTGATSDRPGLIEAADGGTLFLDEIGEMSPAMQVRLLRVLENGEVRRVGDTHDRKVALRVIAATNRDLSEEVREKRFREDLFYRVSVFPIRVPPLRERREDIPALAARFLKASSARFRKPIEGFDPEALDRLSAYDWPGNVRQLLNEIERAVAVAPAEGRISLECLSEAVLAAGRGSRPRPAIAGSLKEALRAFERDSIVAALHEHADSVTHTARALGISRQLLHRRLKELGIR